MYSVEYVNKNKGGEFLYMRHYKFFADSNYLLSIINCLKERGCQLLIKKLRKIKKKYLFL